VKLTAASEEELVRRLRSGDARALGQIYDTYNAAIYNLCARIVGDREEAKDLTHEVFLRAFTAPPEHRAEAGLRPWLYRVATNLSLNHLRTARRRVGAGGDELEQVAMPIDSFQQAQTVALVEETLGRLNDRYRTALVLKDLHGLPSEELASVMETSRASADVLVHRARASFRSIFARLAGEGTPAPGNLALVLAPLALPAALQVMPPLPQIGPSSLAPSAHPLDGSGGGLVAKLSSALGSKVAIAAATASLVAGGLAVDRVVTRSASSAREPVAAAAADLAVSERPASAAPAVLRSGTRLRVEHWAGHGCPTGDASCTTEHSAGGQYGTARDGGYGNDVAGSGAQARSSTTTHQSTAGRDAGGDATYQGATGSGGTHDGEAGGDAGAHEAGAASGAYVANAGTGSPMGTHDGVAGGAD
jgi:RNA polymerase sigma-70 factor (ECF subfamily)